MAEYNKKWANLFPATIGNQTRPSAGVDNTLQYETDKFPQHIANDPVRYDKMNAVVSQSMSNDERLNEKIKRTSDDLAAHNKDPKAHATGISGNAATATKVVTTAATGASANIAEATMASNDLARIRVSGETNAGELALETADDGSEPIVARQYTGIYTTPVRTAKILDESGNTSFPGTVVAPKFTGSLNGNAATATKLATPRTLSLSGKAAGSATFDGSANASINVTSVNADTATTANNDSAGNNIANTYVRHYQNIGEKDLNDLKIGGLYANPLNVNATAERHYPEVNHAGSIFVINNGANGDDGCTQVYTTYDSHNSYKREYDVNSKTWSAWRRYAFEDSTVANAQKLSTARKINITGNATGSASFDGSSDISISITVNESKHAATATTANTATNASHATNADKANTANVATNANHASNADSATKAIALNTFDYRPSDANIQKGDGLVRYFLATGNMKSNKPMKDAQILHLAWDNPGWDSQLAITNIDGDIQTRSQRSGTWGAWKTFLNENNYNNYAPTKTGGGASGTWGINISGNAASATNADKLDGYHASDLLRTLGGNRTPVITDIFDRAGTIDMSTMSAADKATHKANINKASNVTQNIWNNDTGIHAYGGDLDIAGYHLGALKLTQSYKNFDKILVVGSNDDGDSLLYVSWDVWKLAYAFTHSYRFHLFYEGDYWFLYGSVRTGTNTNYSLSTDTIWNTQSQNCGIVAIYGIKF